MHASHRDPAPVDWATIELPATWPDALDLSRPSGWWRLLTHVLRSQRAPVVLPPGVPGADGIPRYALREFHNLPNGNYSHRVTRGYGTGFDLSMLGVLGPARARIATALRECRAVLDLGCGAGHCAAASKAAGVPEVWGLDPSPYLLQVAARRQPQVRWTQGLAEKLAFGDERFDGISACFVFHELPPRYGDEALEEIRRVLEPGGLFALLEPSSEQRRLGSRQLLMRYGWRAPYYRGLAHFVHEPFLDAWHERRIPEWLDRGGFELLEDDRACPLHFVLARKSGP